MISRFLLLLLMTATAHARSPWTTSRIQGSPELAKPFIADEILTQQDVADVLEIVSLPGKIIVAENGGKIWSLPRDLSASTKDLMIDLKAKYPALDHTYGMAFHPKWRENKEVFVTYTLRMGRSFRVSN